MVRAYTLAPRVANPHALKGVIGNEGAAPFFVLATAQILGVGATASWSANWRCYEEGCRQ